MSITFRQFNQDEYINYRKWSIKEYSDDLIKSGAVAKDKAYQIASGEFASLLPQGMETANNYFFIIVNEQNEDIGMIWYVMDKPEEVFISDLMITEKNRKRGYGKQALFLLEQMVMSLGIKKISFHVLDSNTAAIALYRSVGYDMDRKTGPDSGYMSKRI